MDENKQKWVKWIGELQAIAQNDLAYCKDPYDKNRYCALQKVVAEIIANYSECDLSQVFNLLADGKGYLTPKLDVRAAIFRDDKILLVQERMDNLWSLPGGWVDVNDSPGEAVEREVLEETGFCAKATKLLALYDNTKHDHPPQLPHIHKCFFLCEIISGEAKPSIETLDVRFFAEDNLPQLSLPRVTNKQIHRLFQHSLHLDWPTDFD